MQTRPGVLLTLVSGFALLAVACSGNEEPRSEATNETPAPIATRSPGDATSTALQPVGTTEATPEPLATSPGPDSTSEPISPAGSSNEPPVTTAAAGGQPVEMGIGTYCWGNLCVDKIGPVTRGTLQIESGEQVVVAVPGGPALRTVNATAFPAGEPIAQSDGESVWQPDFNSSVMLNSAHDGEEVRIDGVLEPGTYVLTVGMFFDTGDVLYGVVIEVN